LKIEYLNSNAGLLKTAGALTLNWDLTNGMLTGTVLGNITDAITPNIFGELSRYQAFYSGSSIFDIQYGERDKLGRITTKTETVAGETHSYAYVYDPDTDRLTDVYKDGTLVSHYEYDENGNRLRYTGINGIFNGIYDAQDRLLAYGNHTYEYTANGELAKKIVPEGQTQYVYDVLGNLKLVILPDGKRIEYVIDSEDRRIGKKINGALIQGFLYEGDLSPAAELDNNGNIIARFIYATDVNVPDFMIKGGVTYRIIKDNLGSPRIIVNTSTGEIVQRIEYNEFGNVLSDTNPGFQPFGFAGGLYDQYTKLVKFGARDYDSEIGRWIIKDSASFNGGDSNLYGYAGCDPINWIDSEGFARKKGKTPPGSWPKLPKNIAGKNPKWNSKGYWEGANGGDYTWDDRSHGSKVNRGKGPQGGHWDDENSNNRWDPNGRLLPTSVCPIPQKVPQINYRRVGQTAYAVGTGALVAYGVYRVARFAPSLFPPLWPTIPLNLAIP
jgi:RHS repeat-associated protein